MQPDPLLTPGTAEVETPGLVGTPEIITNDPTTYEPETDGQQTAAANQQKYLAQNPNPAPKQAGQ